jgi:hypothetical protein
MGLGQKIKEAELDAAETNHALQLQAVLFLFERDYKWN